MNDESVDNRRPILLTIRDGDDRSPTLYCRYRGLAALRIIQGVVHEMDLTDVHSVMCNVISKLMGGEYLGISFYIYDHDKVPECYSDVSRWEYDVSTDTWMCSEKGIMTDRDVMTYLSKRIPVSYPEECI
ncbi:MAG: hypothetical protein IJT54_01845 [Candidatus Methanomethylophilaceae archaeon]|nr:hypothetical protein [Candidatus Methanomethylophilaceae archaeon]